MNAFRSGSAPGSGSTLRSTSAVAPRGTTTTRPLAGERGAAATMLVLFLPVLLTCLYATCGLGALLLARARAQTAADLA